MICEEKNCCGCSACHDICPVNAITIDDSEGFYRPRLDAAKCIHCGKCREVCPILNPRADTCSVMKCFAAWSKDSDTQFKSSSGGIASELAKFFCRAGGAVIGSRFDAESLRVRHVVCEREEETDCLRGSKYVYSMMEGIYREAAKLFPRNLLFVGVPCQVHALQSFCRVSGLPQDNLFTVELLCHGGASPLCFGQHLQAVANRKKIADVTFRGGEYDCRFSVLGRDRRVIFQEGQYSDAYFAAFMRHSVFQEICYSCPYTGPHRTGDITLGDFWGLNDETLELTGRRGVNVLLVNNAKGAELVEVIRDRINLVERELSEALPENETLIEPTGKPEEYSRLWELIRSKGFSKAYRNVYPVSVKQRIKRSIKAVLRKMLAPARN